MGVLAGGVEGLVFGDWGLGSGSSVFVFQQDKGLFSLGSSKNCLWAGWALQEAAGSW
eukprot:COSAG02_NODE_541_length_20598_cov_278.953754_1_plen_57_part_00